ncbi:hypothetical protein N7454_002127 [Penicillium verhagenii]|nr:hypothetical protein N7454_002127 [Penicillium verhagenii]
MESTAPGSWAGYREKLLNVWIIIIEIGKLSCSLALKHHELGSATEATQGFETIIVLIMAALPGGISDASTVISGRPVAHRSKLPLLAEFYVVCGIRRTQSGQVAVRGVGGPGSLEDVHRCGLRGLPGPFRSVTVRVEQQGQIVFDQCPFYSATIVCGCDDRRISEAMVLLPADLQQRCDGDSWTRFWAGIAV